MPSDSLLPHILRCEVREPAFVELDAAGHVMDLNERARQSWQWRIGSRPPDDFLWTLSAMEGELVREDEPVKLPIVQNGLHITAMPKEGGTGWFLFGEGDGDADKGNARDAAASVQPDSAGERLKNKLRELAASCFDAHIFRDGAVELLAQSTRAAGVAVYERSHPGSTYLIRTAASTEEPFTDIPERAASEQLESLPPGMGSRLRLASLRDRYGVSTLLLFIWPAANMARRAEPLEDLARLYHDLHVWIRTGNMHAHAADVIDDALFGYRIGDDGERRYTFATRQMENLMGRSRDMLLMGQFGWMQRIVHTGDVPLVRAHHANLSAGNESRVTYRVTLPDGGFRWLQEFASPRIGDGSETVIYGILTDVTERREAEIMMQEARREAEEVASGRTSFVARMSHEIRTPLGALNGYAQLLARECEEFEAQRGERLPEQVHEFIESIAERSQKVLVLVQDLFDLSQLEMGQVRVQQNRVNVAPILQRVADRLEPQLEGRDIHLVLQLDASRCDVVGDARRIEQVLENMASNASKFTESGRIELGADVRDAWVAISVRDTGIGISPTYVDQVFEAYTQEDAYLNRRFEGTGLGLALSRRLIELMGGRIEVDSRQGEGSCFTVFLPRPDEADSPARIARSA